MRYLTLALYGLVIGNFLMKVGRRLYPSGNMEEDRFAIVGMHSGREEFIFVGLCNNRARANEATNFLEDHSLFYIGLCYDLWEPGDRAEFEGREYASTHEAEDDDVINVVRGICERHG